MPRSRRYAILRHEGIDSPHFDLMFETAPGSALATWRAEVWPIRRPVAVQRLPDHRRIYLDYEGPISGGRGSVRQVEAARCLIEGSDEAGWMIRFENGNALRFDPVETDWQAIPVDQPPA